MVDGARPEGAVEARPGEWGLAQLPIAGTRNPMRNYGMRMACTRPALHVQVLAVHAEFWPCLATPAHRSFADAYFRVRSESSRRCVKRRQPQAAPPPPRKQPSKGEKPNPKGKNEEDR